MNQPIKRRTFLKGVAGTAAASTLGFPYIATGAGKTLVINSYGGSFEKFMRSEIIPPFEEKTGIKTTVDINLKFRGSKRLKNQTVGWAVTHIPIAWSPHPVEDFAQGSHGFVGQ